MKITRGRFLAGLAALVAGIWPKKAPAVVLDDPATKEAWRRAMLNGANLSGANLSGVIGLTQGQIDGCLGDEETVLPSHLQRPAHWIAKGRWSR